MYLRQSTSQVFRIGPFLDSTDGVTPETGLTIANTDVDISKDGAAFASKNSGGLTVDGSNGWYSGTFDTTDTNTIGEFLAEVTVSGALPVWVRYWVIEEAVYDAMFGASAEGPLQGTTSGNKLDVTATGGAGINWGNVENQGTSVDLSATGINLTNTCTTNTDMRGTDSANVLTQVNAALDTAISELGVGVPTVTPSTREALILLYMALRNKTTVQTSGTDALEINNDAGVIIAKKSLTDDGSDLTSAKMTSG